MIIIDNKNYINTISSNVLDHLGLKIIPHPMSYNMSWVNNNSIVVNARCLFPMQLLDYHDEICCDVILMDVGYVGHAWHSHNPTVLQIVYEIENIVFFFF